MKSFFEHLMHDIKSKGNIVLLSIETTFFAASSFDIFNKIIPDNLKWVNAWIMLFCVLIIVITICSIIILKKVNSKLLLTTGESFSTEFRYSNRQRILAKIVLVFTTLLFTFGLGFSLKKHWISHEELNINDIIPIKIIVSQFQPNSQVDEFSSSLRTIINAELLKRECDSITAIKSNQYYSIDSVTDFPLGDTFKKFNSKKGILACGDFWESTLSFNCNLYIYNLPLEFNMKSSAKKEVLILRAPDTVKIKDVQGQSEYVANLIIAILSQRLKLYEESNKIIQRLLEKNNIRTSFRVLCYRIMAENSICENEYTKANQFLSEAHKLDPDDYYISRCLSTFETKNGDINNHTNHSNPIITTHPHEGKEEATFLIDSNLNSKQSIPQEKSVLPLQFTYKNDIYQLDTNRMTLGKIPESIKKIASLSSTNTSQLSCLTLAGDIQKEQLVIKIIMPDNTCLDRITLALFSDLDKKPLLEVKVEISDRAYSKTLSIPYDFFNRSDYASKIKPEDLKKIFIYGRLEFSYLHNIKDEFIYMYIQ
jgi:tetratricopeptide (TPR) repeat protein